MRNVVASTLLSHRYPQEPVGFAMCCACAEPYNPLYRPPAIYRRSYVKNAAVNKMDKRVQDVITIGRMK